MVRHCRLVGHYHVFYQTPSLCQCAAEETITCLFPHPLSFFYRYFASRYCTEQERDAKLRYNGKVGVGKGTRDVSYVGT